MTELLLPLPPVRVSPPLPMNCPVNLTPTVVLLLMLPVAVYKTPSVPPAAPMEIVRLAFRVVEAVKASAPPLNVRFVAELPGAAPARRRC